MKKLILVCTLFITALIIHANIVFADDCTVGRTPEGVYPIKNVDIIMEDEDIRIYPYEGRAECTFEFLNTGDEKDVAMGFPCQLIPDPDSLGGDTTIRDFTATDETGVLKVTTDKAVKPPKSFDSRFDEFSSWFSFSSHFKKGQKKIIKNTYKFSMSVYSTGDNLTGYIIKTGSVWKDKIGHAKVTFFMPGLKPYYMEFLNGEPYFRFDSDKIVWERTDFEPLEDIQLYFKQFDKLIKQAEGDYKDNLIKEEKELIDQQNKINKMGKDELLNLLDFDTELRAGLRLSAYERLLKLDSVYGKRILLKIGINRATVNGIIEAVNNDSYGTDGPQIKGGRTFVPLRFIIENMGGDIEWDGALKQIKINHEGKTVVMKIGQKTYSVDNVSKTMDAAPEIVNGRTIVPLRFVSESVGYDVQWFEKDKKILISGKKDFMELGFRIVHEESIGSLALETEDKECVKIMGVADEKSEAVVTEADGLQHQTWYYKSKGTTLDMVRSDENKQIINSISVTKPCNFKTKRNIGIGSSRNDVLNAYGEFVNNEDSKNADSITLGSVYGGMILTLDKDVVTEIFIGAAAE